MKNTISLINEIGLTLSLTGKEWYLTVIAESFTMSRHLNQHRWKEEILFLENLNSVNKSAKKIGQLRGISRLTSIKIVISIAILLLQQGASSKTKTDFLFFVAGRVGFSKNFIQKIVPLMAKFSTDQIIETLQIFDLENLNSELLNPDNFKDLDEFELYQFIRMALITQAEFN